MVTPLPPTRRRRPPLTTAAIVVAARRLIAAKGMEACSMRSLVAALGVQAPALYRRIGSKEALLALVLDHVMGDLTPPPDDGPWPEQLAELMRRLRALFARKPHLAALFAVSTPAGPNALRFIAAASAPLRRAGFTDAQASFAITALTTHVIGFTFLAANRSSGPVQRQVRATLRHQRARAGADTGTAYAVLEETQRGDADRLFEFGLRHLIAGLAADLHRTPSTRSRDGAKGMRPLRASAPAR
jgi:AcrR family transcriptional regulator